MNKPNVFESGSVLKLNLSQYLFEVPSLTRIGRQHKLFDEVPLSLDRVGITVSSPFLCSTMQYIGDIEHPYHPKNFSRLIRKNMESLKEAGIQVVEKKEYFKGSNSGCKPGWLVAVQHPFYGPITIRVFGWFPFAPIVYLNFNRMLQVLFERKGIPYKLAEGSDNAFEEMPIPKELLRSLAVEWFDIEKLRKEVVLPILWQILPDLAPYFNNCSLRFNQVEAPIELNVKSKYEAVEAVYFYGAKHMRKFRDWKMMDKNGVPVLSFKLAGGVRAKLYPKGRVIRFELTYDTNWMKENGFSRESMEEILAHAGELYRDLARLTKHIKLRGHIPKDFIEALRNFFRSEKDIKLLNALVGFAGDYFKNKDLQKKTKLTRNEVYHRFKRKLFWLVGRVEKEINGTVKKSLFWRMPAEAVHALNQILAMLRKVGALFRQLMGQCREKEFFDSIVLFDAAKFAGENG